MLYQETTLFDFTHSFTENLENKFTYEGKETLYNFLNHSEAMIEFDPVELCEIYTEYANIKAFHKENNKEDYPTIEDIKEQTIVIMIDDNSFIINNF